jgi:hypothetical protein
MQGPEFKPSIKKIFLSQGMGINEFKLEGAQYNALLCWHTLGGLMSKGQAPKTKGYHLIYLCKQVSEAIKLKKQDLTHIWLYAILKANSP